MTQWVRRKHTEAAATVRIALALVAAIASAAGVTTVYALGGGVQLEGLFLGTMLGSLGVAAVLWGKHLMPGEPVVEVREPLASSEEDRRVVAEELGPESVTRRRLLRALLLGAGGAAVAAFFFPVRSLGPLPAGALFHTPWQRGRRAVDVEGRPVRADDVRVDAFTTVFPDGHVGSADGQAVLVRVQPGLLEGEAADGSADDGLLAFSKVCTHLGCAVNLYQAEEHLLLCPCHQSTFDVLDRGAVTFGPATRALPRLPIAVDEQGFVVALDDFDDAVGPGFWYRPE
ncbi:MAG TPA: Rieske 2Fe-2S domain-containing protein [Acidimicrobiia bacterium]|nr:Rieske 2Fe-2S domain-containing protein [Acidimicrobiia bacterium]